MSVAWSPDRRAANLLPRRAELLDRLPRAVAAARRLNDDERELIVDDALTYVVVEYRGPIRTAAEAERVYWRVVNLRVARALEGRQATVRAGFDRATSETLDRLASTTDDPAEAVERAQEIELATEFAATLDAVEGQVLRAKWLTGATTPVGYRKVADELGIPSAQARAAERSINSKLERFAALMAAGRLCAERSEEITALAAGTAALEQVRRAKAHLKHCSACKTDYVMQLRGVRSAAFQRTVAGVVPAVPIADQAREDAGRFREFVADWIGRLGSHDATQVSQAVASGTGRGAGAALTVKVAALLASGAAAVGVATGVLDRPHSPQRREPAATATPKPTATPARRSTPQPQPTPTPKAKHVTKHTSTAKTQGGTGPTDHEQAPASPAAPGSQPGGASEFTPQAANSQPPPAAPVQAAPGSSEFP